jgi:flagellar basal body-associated protein FliL
MLLFIPLTRVNLSIGTIAGRNAPTDGIWTPSPIARTADTTNSIHIEPYPIMNSMAIIKVETAMRESDKIISSFLSYRSAHTPAKGEIKKVGRKPQIMDIVIIIPD